MTEKAMTADQNPFSREKAWQTWQRNMTNARRLREEVRTDLQASDRTRLLWAVEAIGCLTDNTVFLRIVQKALEARDAG